jgi:hypothetical protein
MFLIHYCYPTTASWTRRSCYIQDVIDYISVDTALHHLPPAPPPKKKNLNHVCEMTFEVYIRSRRLCARSCVVTGKCTRQLMQLVSIEISKLCYLFFIQKIMHHSRCVLWEATVVRLAGDWLCLHLQQRRPEGGWNMVARNYKISHPRRQPFSDSPPWEPEIWQPHVFFPLSKNNCGYSEQKPHWNTGNFADVWVQIHIRTEGIVQKHVPLSVLFWNRTAVHYVGFLCSRRTLLCSECRS